MKRLFKTSTILFVSLGMFISCNIGLGQTVDTEAPELSITVPDPASVVVIRDDFPIKGTWSDDGTIDSVEVSLKSGESLAWSAEASFETSPDAKGEGTWSVIARDIPDGSYLVSVKITDKSKHASTVTSSIIIDNTAPIIVLSRPSTEASSSSPDSYGQTFSLQGSAADDNNVSLVEVKIYSDEALTNEVHTIQLQNVPNSIDLDIAHFVSGDTSNDYYQIYGSSDISAGEKTFYCSLVAYDGAIRIPTDGSAQTASDLKGNASDKYYLNDSVSDLLRTYKISGLYQIKNGSYSSENVSREVTDNVIASLSAKEITAGVFTLNPANNPTFTMADSYVLSFDDKGNVDWSNVYNNTSATLTVSPGLDGIAINSASLKVYAQKCNAAGVITDTTKIYPSTSSPEESGTSYKITPSVLKSEGFEYNSYYIWGIEGADASGNVIMPASSTGYGFFFSTQGLAPTLIVSEPSASTSYVAKDAALHVSGSVEYKEYVGNFAIYLGDTKIVSAAAGVAESGLSFVQDSSNELKYAYDYSIPAAQISSIANSKSSQLTLKVQADNSYVTKDVKYDADAPLVTIKVSPIATKYEVDSQGYAKDETGTSSGSYVNGEVEVTVSVKDEYDVISSLAPVVSISGQSDKTIITSGADKSKSATYTVDTRTLTDNSTFTASVTAYDRAGNKTVQSVTYTVLQETDKPVILPSNSSSLSLISMKAAENVTNQTSSEEKKNLFFETDGDKHLILSIRDDDAGQCTVNYWLEDADGNAVPELGTSDEPKTQKVQITNGKGTFDATLGGITSGEYKITICVLDSINSRTVSFWVRVVPDAPELSLKTFANNPYIRINNSDSLESTGDIVSTSSPFKLTYQVKRGLNIIEAFKDYDSLNAIECTENSGTYSYINQFIPDSSAAYTDGTYTIVYRVFDSNGLSGDSEEKTFYIDNAVPALTGSISVPTTIEDCASAFKFEAAINSSASVIAPETYYFAFTEKGESQPAESVFKAGTAANTYTLRYKDESFENIFTSEGEKTVWYYAKDTAENTSNVYKTNFFYDLKLPEVSVSVADGYSSYNKSRFKLSINASDSWGLSKTELFENGSLIENFDNDSEYPSSQILADYGEYKYVAKVTDKAGRTKESSELTVYIDTKEPTINFGLAEGCVLSGGTGVLSGTIADTGYGSSYLYYCITDDDNAPEESSYSNKPQANGTWEISQLLEEDSSNNSTNTKLREGKHYLWVYGQDKAGNISEPESLMFYVDQKAPEISSSATITGNFTAEDGSVMSGSVKYLKMGDGTITLTGTIQETNELQSVSCSAAQSVSSTDNHDGTYAYTLSGIAFSENVKKMDIKVVAKDVANQSSDITFTLYNDTTAPTIAFINPSSTTPAEGDNSIKGESYTYKATLEDSDAKLKIVKYAITDSADTPASYEVLTGVSGKTTYSFSKAENLTNEGKYWLHLYAEDSVGNIKKDSVFFWVDQSAPSLEVDPIDKASAKNSGFTLSGNASDTNALSSLVIKEGDTVHKAFTNLSGTSWDWEQAFRVGSENTDGAISLTDGSHTFTITATDVAGRTKTQTASVFIDTVSPTGSCSVDSVKNYISGSGDKLKNWYNTHNISVLVSGVSDGSNSSGIAEVKATTDKVDGSVTPSWTSLSLEKNSSNQYSGSIYCSEQGKHTISYLITDNAGNSSGYLTSLVYIDTEAPDTAEVSSVVMGTGSPEDLTETILVNGKKDATVVLAAADANASTADAATGIKSIILKKIGNNSISGVTGIQGTGDNADKWTFTIPGGSLKTGSMVFELTDNVDKSWEYTSDVNFDLDNLYPSVTIDSITYKGTSISVTDANKEITINGKASDNNTLKSLQLQYRTSESNTFSGKWNNYGSAITDAESMASWSINVDTTDTSKFPTNKPYVQFCAIGTDTAQNTGNIGRKLNSGEEESTASGNSNAIKAVKIDQKTDIPVITFTNLVIQGMNASSLAKVQNTTIRGNITDDDGTITKLEYSVALDTDNEPIWHDANLSGVTFSFTLDDDTYSGDKKLRLRVTDKAGGLFISDDTSDSPKSAPRIKGLKEKDKTDLVEITDTKGAVYLIVDTTDPSVINIKASQTGADNSWDAATFKTTFGGDSDHNKFYIDLYAWDKNGINSVSYEIGGLTGTLTQGDGSATVDGNVYTEYTSSAISVSTLTRSGQYTLNIIVTDNGGRSKTNTQTIDVDKTAPVIKITSHEESDQEGSAFYMEGSFEDGDVGTKLYYKVTSTQTVPTSWSEDNLSYGNSSISWKLYFDSEPTSVVKEGADGYTHYLLPKYIIDDLRSDVVISNGTAYVADSSGNATSTKYTTVGTYYFHFKVVDSYGNYRYSNLPLKLDPQGDIPTVKLEYPAVEKYAYYNASSKIWEFSESKSDTIKKDNVPYEYVAPMATMSGIIRASGSATLINDSLDLYMQIDPSFVPDLSKSDKDKGFSSTWYEEMLTGFAEQKAVNMQYEVTDFGPDGSKKKGIPLGTSLSWSKNINTSSEFEIYNSDETNYIAIRLYAYDNKGNFSQTDDDIFIIRINSGAPKIGSSVPLQLKQYDATGNVTAVLDYTDKMWIKGEWYLEGSIEDENGIDDISITGGDATLIKSSEITWGSGASATKGYTFKYKVGSTSASSTLTYEISATDVKKAEESGSHTSTKTITLRCDNNAPTLAPLTDDYYNISSEVINSNGFYTVQSAATEPSGESGFLRTVVYFKRTVSGYQNIYDSYIKKGCSGNAVAYSGLHEEDNLYWKTGSVSSIDPSAKTVTISDTDDNIHKGGLVKLGGVIFTIKDKDGTTLTLNEAPDSSIKNGDSIYFAIGHVIDHVGSESVGSTLGSSDEGYGYYPISSDNDDYMIESVSTVGTKTRWMGKINSQNIPDGSIEIHYVVFDQAGNVAHEKVDAVVQNNAPRLASLKVYTDYNGNGSEDSGEYKTYYYSGKTRRFTSGSETRATDVTKKLVVSGNGYGPTDSTAGTAYMTVRGDVIFTPEIIGGNDALYFSYKSGSASALAAAEVTNGGALKNASGTELSGTDSTTGSYIKSDEDSQSYVEGQTAEITLEESSLGSNSTEDAPTWFEYTIWDSTPGTTVYTNSLNAKFQVALHVIATDTIKPKAVVSPFFWESSDKNSLYHNNRENGHIELEADWENASGYTSSDLASDLKDADPKVSGKITVRGSVYDDVQLNEIYVKIPGFIPGTYAFSTSYVRVAYYTNGVWTPIVADDTDGTNMETNHWTFSVADEYNNGSGHKANWEFSWDTSYITGVAAKDVTFYVQAVAENGSANYNTSIETDATTDTSDAAYNKPTYQMDIVPYITSLTTSLSSIKPTNPSIYDRTALGHYPVYINITNADPNGNGTKETDVDTITVNGFNLDDASTSYTLIANLTSDEISTSGEISVTVNGIPSLNNYNKNDAQGTYGYDTTKIPAQGSKDIYDNFYNRLPNGANNNNLTDDVYIDVWQFNSKAAVSVKGHIDQPIMKINPATDQVGFAFADGALYYSMPGKVKVNNVDTEHSYYYWMGAYDSFTSVALAYDKLGYSYGVGAGGDINDSNPPSMDNLSLMSSRWGICGHSAGASKADNNNHIRLEKIGQYDSSNSLVVNKQRIQSPSLATTVSGDNTNVYLAYYDATNEEVRFRYGTFESNTFANVGTFINVDGVGALCYDKDYNNGTRTSDIVNVNLVAGSNSATGKAAGKYVSIAAIPGSTDTVVIVWYEETSRTLWYAYNSSPLSSSTGTNSGSEWHVSRVFSDNKKSYYHAGENCKIAVDANGHVHIAAYDQNNGNLVYAYTSTPTVTNPNFQTCIVDSSGTVGSNISLDVALKSAGGQAIPRIGYYAASCIRPKLAWLNSTESAPAGAVSDSFTGAWECTVLPTQSTLIIDNSKQTNLINVAVWKDKDTGVIKTSTKGTDSITNSFNKYDSTNYGSIWGNGISTSILGYVISQDASNDSIEVAQMR